MDERIVRAIEVAKHVATHRTLRVGDRVLLAATVAP